MFRRLIGALAALVLSLTVLASPSVSSAQAYAENGLIAEDLYLVKHSGELWFVDHEVGFAYPITYEEWEEAGFPSYKPAPTDYVKYSWSPSISAVTFFGKNRDQWEWTHLDMASWTRAGRPAPRTAGWIEDSYWYQWGTSSQILVEDAGGFNHVLTYAQWQAAGYPQFEARSNEGFFRLRWDASGTILRYDSINGSPQQPTNWARAIGYAEWQAEGFPAPQVVERLPSHIDFLLMPNGQVRYAARGYSKVLSYAEWQSAGFPPPSPAP